MVNNNAYHKDSFVVKSYCHLSYVSKEEDLSRLKKEFVGFLIKAYNIQMCFETEGYFSIKVTPLRDNLCLLEVKIRDLIREGKSWWNKWFSDIREWREDDVDKKRESLS